MRNRELGSYLLFLLAGFLPAFSFLRSLSSSPTLFFLLPLFLPVFLFLHAPAPALLRAPPQDVSACLTPMAHAGSPVSLGTAPSEALPRSAPPPASLIPSFLVFCSLLYLPFPRPLAASLLTPPQCLSVSNHPSPTFSSRPVINTGYSLCSENSRTSLG